MGHRGRGSHDGEALRPGSNGVVRWELQANRQLPHPAMTGLPHSPSLESVVQPTSAPGNLIGLDSPETPELDRLERTLDRHIWQLHIQGAIAFCVTAFVAGWIYFDIKANLNGQAQFLERARNPTQVLAYLIFRASALAAIATVGVVLGTRITLASYDQALRFTKRRMAAMFLQHLYREHWQQLRSPVTLRHLMAFFETWNKTVESAFSAPRVEKESSVTGDLARTLADKLIEGREP